MTLNKKVMEIRQRIKVKPSAVDEPAAKLDRSRPGKWKGNKNAYDNLQECRMPLGKSWRLYYVRLCL